MFPVGIVLMGPVVESISTVDLAEPVTPGTPIKDIRVYAKNALADDWDLEPNLFCDFCEWVLSPNLPTAQLTWRYGQRLVNNTWTTYNPFPRGTRKYVRIEVDDWYNSQKRVWHGLFGHISDEAGGVQSVAQEGGGSVTVRKGVQRIQCVGLEKMLLDRVIRDAYVWDEESETTLTVQYGLTFNAPLSTYNPSGNKSGAATLHPLFSNQPREDDAFWNANEIVEHLLTYHHPRDRTEAAGISIDIAAGDLALISAATYRPVLETEGKTIKELLDQLISRRRLLSYYLELNDSNEISLKVVSWSRYTLAINGTLIALPNGNKINLDNDAAYGVTILTTSHHEPVEQIRVRGARVRSMFTMAKPDNTLIKGWSNTLETTYETAASGETIYTDTTDREVKKRLNAARRAQPDLATVFAFFQLPDDWDGLAGDGVGGGGNSIIPPDLSIPATFRRETLLLDTLPAITGYDWSANAGEGNRISGSITTPGPYYEPAPFVLLKASDDTYHAAAELGQRANPAKVPEAELYSFSCQLYVPQGERGFFLRTQGAPQHILAKNDFTPLANVDDVLGAWDWQTMLATVAVQLPAYCEAIYPPAAAIPNFDYIREAVFHLGDQYRLDYLTPYTVLGVNASGELVYNSTGGYLRDDRAQLAERAKLAYTWLSVPRHSLQITTMQISATPALGAYVCNLGGLDPLAINGVISKIRVESPAGTPGNTPAPTITYTTEYLEELDI